MKKTTLPLFFALLAFVGCDGGSGGPSPSSSDLLSSSGEGGILLRNRRVSTAGLYFKFYARMPQRFSVDRSFSRCSGDSSQSGRRYSSAIFPTIAIAALIGIGLVSMN